MHRVWDFLLPPRLGRPFRWLVASIWSSNLADGILLAAGPLLLASLTTNAFLISLGALAVWLPNLLLGLLAGVLSDRIDRRRIIVYGNLLRVLVLAALATSILLNFATISLVLVCLFLLACVESFVDNATGAMTPSIVPREHLALANQRQGAGYLTMNQLGGPPLGAALFVVGHAVPAVAGAVLIAAAALLAARIRMPEPEEVPPARRRVLGELWDGLRWTARNPAVRTLILTIFIFNLTFGAAWSVLVIYAIDRLHLGEVGFGLITTVIAAGGIVATLGYMWVIRYVSLTNLMRIGLIIETLTHLALALTTVPLVAMSVFFIFGIHQVVWGMTSGTLRQRIVPLSLQGRVRGVYSTLMFGGLVVGAAVGGVLAQVWGVTAPFWYAFVGSAVFVVLIWRSLRHLATADEE